MSSVVYGAMDQEARSIHLDKFRKGKVGLWGWCSPCAHLAWLVFQRERGLGIPSRVCVGARA